MKAQDIVLQNLKRVLQASDLTFTSFAVFCKEHGIAVDKSMFSRLNNGSSLKFDKIEPIIEGVRLLPGYENYSFSDLMAEPTAAKQAPVFSFEQLSQAFAKMYVDLDELGWVKLNTDLQMSTLTDLAILAVKNSGATVVKQDETNTKLTG